MDEAQILPSPSPQGEGTRVLAPFSLGRRVGDEGNRDLESAAVVSLFNPRLHNWADHFTWTADGTRMVRLTPMGRATCDRLDVNDDRYQGERSITEARSLWVEAGWHPPGDDPRQSE